MLVLVVVEQEPEAVPVVVAEVMMVGQWQQLEFFYIHSHAQSLLPWWGS